MTTNSMEEADKLGDRIGQRPNSNLYRRCACARTWACARMYVHAGVVCMRRAVLHRRDRIVLAGVLLHGKLRASGSSIFLNAK